jgi:amino acid transporter
MKKAKKHILSLFLIIFLLVLPTIIFFTPNSVIADENLAESQVGLETIGQSSFGYGNKNIDFRIQVIRIINLSLSFLGVIFVGLIVFSGYEWMVAGGNDDKVAKAKKRLINAVIGLCIVLASWTISYFILRRLAAITTNEVNYLNPSPF